MLVVTLKSLSVTNLFHVIKNLYAVACFMPFTFEIAVENFYCCFFRVIFGGLVFFCLMIYDHETGIAHKIVRTLFQCGPFYWVVHITFPTTEREQYGKIEPKYLRVVTARVYYVIRGSLTSPFILINSVKTALLFYVATQVELDFFHFMRYHFCCGLYLLTVKYFLLYVCLNDLY